MKVVIRAEASTSVGIGHLMRCLALGQALRDGGDEVTLACTARAGESLLEPWRREDIRIHTVEASVGTPDDARATHEIVRSSAAAWLCVDGYGFGPEFRSRARGTSRLVWVDDHGSPGVEADLIVNGNVYGSEALYPDTSARIAAGPRYALLRREFRARSVEAAVRNGLLVSLGGADPEGRTGPLLAAMAARGIRGRVVVGAHQRGSLEIRYRAPRLGWEVIDAPADMSALLASCELAVVGAGTTALEALAVATPMVAVRIAENQRSVAVTLDRLGLAVVAEGNDPNTVASQALALLADATKREALAQRGQGIIDGRGALRVAGEMRGALLTLRPATIGDANLMLEWRNDPDTRRSSFNTEEVSIGEHRRWLAVSLESKTRHLLLGEVEAQPIGVVRLDVTGTEATISITIAPAARGAGIASPLLRQALVRADELGVSRVEARIRPENSTSRHAFFAAGFSEAGGPSAEAKVVRMFASPLGRG